MTDRVQWVPLVFLDLVVLLLPKEKLETKVPLEILDLVETLDQEDLQDHLVLLD